MFIIFISVISSVYWQHQWPLSTNTALDAEEFPSRDKFATRNERNTQQGYDKNPSTIEKRSLLIHKSSSSNATLSQHCPSTTTRNTSDGFTYRRLATKDTRSEKALVYTASVYGEGEGRGRRGSHASRESGLRFWTAITQKTIRPINMLLFSGCLEQENLKEQHLKTYDDV